MKCSEKWLREWVNPPITQQKLCQTLTMAGLEIEEVTPIAQSADSRQQDAILDISITPNRGDCLSIKGMAREIAALTRTPLLSPLFIAPVAATISDSLPIQFDFPSGCPHYLGRVIKHVKADVATPTWLKERLQHSGINSISPIVDVTNYVMLELGQPMHAFDLASIKEKMIIRKSQKEERIHLLNGSEQTLDDQTLVIADKENPLAIAGVMGGLPSSVTLATTDIFLESAYFSRQVIAKQRQHYNLNSESSYRFERGIDPQGQRDAIERATQLILEICGGQAGPVKEAIDPSFPPAPPVIKLSAQRIEQVLGLVIPEAEIEAIFTALALQTKKDSKEGSWQLIPPLYRWDLQIPEDIIEEIARLYGYDRIPTEPLKAFLEVDQKDAVSILPMLKQAFQSQGYHEIISYSFIAKEWQQQLDPLQAFQELLNPITHDMTVMRTNLWPGLIKALQDNLSRQQQRVRFFEVGTCFITQEGRLEQPQKLAGLITGPAYQEQWGMPVRAVDFYDLKGDICQILRQNLVFKPDSHPALHPGQTAAIYYQEQKIGIAGALHPQLLSLFSLPAPVFVFELDMLALEKKNPLSLQTLSKFPEIRRDLALLVKQAVPAKAIQDTISAVAGDWLKDVFIFDVYQGKNIAPDLKSVALALILQHPTRTLIDDEVAALVERVIVALKGQLGAELRS